MEAATALSARSIQAGSQTLFQETHTGKTKCNWPRRIFPGGASRHQSAQRGQQGLIAPSLIPICARLRKLGTTHHGTGNMGASLMVASTEASVILLAALAPVQSRTDI